jgi:hypothetical protein
VRKSRYMTGWLTVLVTVALYGLLTDSVLAHGRHSSGSIAVQQTETTATDFAQLEGRVDSFATIRGLACSHVANSPWETSFQARVSVVAMFAAAACGGCCDGAGCQSCHGCCYGMTGCNASHSALPGHNLFVGDVGSRGCARPGPTLVLCGQNPTPARKPPRA